MPDVDAGLQPERTALAWRRTALSLVAAGLAGARWALSSSRPTLGIAACGCLAIAGLLVVAQRARGRSDAPGAPTMAACSALVAASAAAALVLGLVE